MNEANKTKVTFDGFEGLDDTVLYSMKLSEEPT
jgi:hypothetical protein